MKLNKVIGHDKQMTPVDFEITRSKVMDTVGTCGKSCWMNRWQNTWVQAHEAAKGYLA